MFRSLIHNGILAFLLIQTGQVFRPFHRLMLLFIPVIECDRITGRENYLGRRIEIMPVLVVGFQYETGQAAQFPGTFLKRQIRSIPGHIRPSPETGCRLPAPIPAHHFHRVLLHPLHYRYLLFHHHGFFSSYFSNSPIYITGVLLPVLVQVFAGRRDAGSADGIQIRHPCVEALQFQSCMPRQNLNGIILTSIVTDKRSEPLAQPKNHTVSVNIVLCQSIPFNQMYIMTFEQCRFKHLFLLPIT